MEAANKAGKEEAFYRALVGSFLEVTDLGGPDEKATDQEIVNHEPRRLKSAKT